MLSWLLPSHMVIKIIWDFGKWNLERRIDYGSFLFGTVIYWGPFILFIVEHGAQTEYSFGNGYMCLVSQYSNQLVCEKCRKVIDVNEYDRGVCNFYVEPMIEEIKHFKSKALEKTIRKIYV